MLVRKAHGVSFVMKDGKTVRAPHGHGLLHDEDAQVWPRCSVLVGPCAIGQRDASLTPKARAYFGPGYRARSGQVVLPPRHLSTWKRIGEVERIFYVRDGNIMGGQRFRHRYADRRFFIFPIRTVLYRHGRFLRLELPGGCIVNRRGFVSP